jgi:hypothetical protein
MRRLHVTQFCPRRLAFVLASALAVTCGRGLLSGQESNFQDGAFLRDARAKDLFSSARVAIFGGPGGIARLRAMRLNGRSRFPASDGTLLSATVEIRVLLPDRYLRIDSGSFGRRIAGYAGNKTLDLIETPDGQAVPNSGDRATVLFKNRAELARLMLGVATYASQEMPLKLQTRETPVAMPGPSEQVTPARPSRLLEPGPDRLDGDLCRSAFDWRHEGAVQHRHHRGRSDRGRTSLRRDCRQPVAEQDRLQPLVPSC